MFADRGSKVILQEPIVCPVGANFLIKNLFFNIPARRKFLKSNHTELSNIVAEFERIALAHPDLSFALSTPDNVLLDLPSGNFRQRIVNIFGRKMDKYLMPVHVETELVEIIGFVGNPESSKKKGAQQFFFANGRYMRHPYFAKAIQSAYERLIPDGEQVPFFLQILINPCRIDVNIHPTKTEIKFEDEQPIWQILRAAVRETLGRFNAIPTIDFDVEDRPDIPVFQDGDVNIAPQVSKLTKTTIHSPILNRPPQRKVLCSPRPPAARPPIRPERVQKGWEGAFENAFDTQDSLASSTVFSSDFAEAEETPAAEATLYEHLPETNKAAGPTQALNIYNIKGATSSPLQRRGCSWSISTELTCVFSLRTTYTCTRSRTTITRHSLPANTRSLGLTTGYFRRYSPRTRSHWFRIVLSRGNSFRFSAFLPVSTASTRWYWLNGMLDDATQKGSEVHEDW